MVNTNTKISHKVDVWRLISALKCQGKKEFYNFMGMEGIDDY